MFDYIKILNAKVHNLASLKSKLKVSTSVDMETSEIVPEIKKIQEQGLTFTFNDKYINIAGSIHVYSNNGKHNYNDFNISSVLRTILQLEKNYHIDIHKTAINNLEIGVNVIVPFKVDDFLSNILFHGGNKYTIQRTAKKTFYEFIHSCYYIKIYNKGKQYRDEYNINDEILRFEIKVSKMDYLHSKGIKIKYLVDLLDSDNFVKLRELLVKTFNDILIYDNSLVLNQLSAKDRIFYENAKNNNYWSALYGDYISYSKTDEKSYNRKRTKFNRQVDKLNDIIAKNNTKNHKKLVGELIHSKWTELSAIDYDTQILLDDLTNDKCINLTANCSTQNTTDCINMTASIYNHNDTRRLCNVTKIELITGINYLSKTDIQYYYSNNKEIFDKLQMEFFKPKNGIYYEVDDMFYLIAHNIRNKDTNKRNNLRNKIKHSISNNQLFDSCEYYKLTDHQTNLLNYWKGTRHEIRLESF